MSTFLCDLQTNARSTSWKQLQNMLKKTFKTTIEKYNVQIGIFTILGCREKKTDVMC